MLDKIAMTYRIAILTALSVPTVAAAQDRRPVPDVEAFSAKSVTDIQTCIARRWDNSMDATIVGPHVDLRFVGPISRSNALTFTVDDLGERRRVTVSYQHPWSARGAKTYFRKAARCWE